MSAQRPRTRAELDQPSDEPRYAAETAVRPETVGLPPPLAPEPNDLGTSEPDHAEPLWQSDTGTLRESSRRALAALLKGPYLSVQRQGELWRALVSDTAAIQSRLADLFLDLVIDPVQGVAFVRNADLVDGAAPQVVRTMSLTFMDTLLLLNLRSELLRSGPGSRAIIGKDEVYEQLQVYRTAASTDEAGFTKRINAAWKKMVDHSILLKTSTEGRFEISPVLRLVFGPDEIAAITAEYQHLLADSKKTKGEPAIPAEDDPESSTLAKDATDSSEEDPATAIEESS